MDVIDRIIKESTMDQSLIAQKFRELADLFDSFDKQVAAANPYELKGPKLNPYEPKGPKLNPVKVEPAAAPIDIAAAPTLDDLRQGMAELIGAGKREKVIAILANLNVKKVSDIEEDKFAAAMSLINDAR
jgi:hypothetical protein